MAAAAIRTLSFKCNKWYEEGVMIVNGTKSTVNRYLAGEHKFWKSVAAETSNASSDSAASACSWVNLTRWGSLINLVLWATTTTKYIVGDYNFLWFKLELK